MNLRKDLANGETLDDILVDRLLLLAREACYRGNR